MPFSKLMGIKIISVTKEKITAEMIVRPDLCTVANILHGGAMMAYADALGGIVAHLNKPENATSTITIESKSNFVSAAPEGSLVCAETTPISIGKRLSVWQTKITGANDKTIAVVTQTQLVIYP
ncbi:MAG: PaaI family thioesterase [Alphaproteobacteria bacterium]|nr:PaaI family thioesterase [Alphaproteobacteria bacterium]